MSAESDALAALEMVSLAGLSDSAGNPKSGTIDGMTVVQHSLAERLELQRYLDSRKGAANPLRGLRVTRLIPPGSI